MRLETLSAGETDWLLDCFPPEIGLESQRDTDEDH